MFAQRQGSKSVKKEFNLQDFLLPSEKVLFHSEICKKRRFSVKKRILVYTDRPRLFYVDPESGKAKGFIDYHQITEIIQRSEKKFDLVTAMRTYNLEAPSEKILKQWVRILLDTKYEFQKGEVMQLDLAPIPPYPSDRDLSFTMNMDQSCPFGQAIVLEDFKGRHSSEIDVMKFDTVLFCVLKDGDAFGGKFDPFSGKIFKTGYFAWDCISFVFYPARKGKFRQNFKANCVNDPCVLLGPTITVTQDDTIQEMDQYIIFCDTYFCIPKNCIEKC